MPPEYFFPLIGMAFALGWGVLGTVRWYFSQQLKAGQGQAGPGEDPARVAALEARVGELEERLDFAERLLARGSSGGAPHA